MINSKHNPGKMLRSGSRDCKVGLNRKIPLPGV